MTAKERPSKSIYFIDACSLTELRRTYPREHFSQVWSLLERLAKEGRLFSVDEVLSEIRAQDDEITEWADEHEHIFLPLSEAIQLKAREILKAHPTLVDLKKKKSGADPFLIAAALVGGGKVVTQEKKSGGPPTVKIPDVCAAVGVECLSLLDLIKAEKLS